MENYWKYSGEVLIRLEILHEFGLELDEEQTESALIHIPSLKGDMIRRRLLPGWQRLHMSVVMGAIRSRFNSCRLDPYLLVAMAEVPSPDVTFFLYLLNTDLPDDILKHVFLHVCPWPRIDWASKTWRRKIPQDFLPRFLEREPLLRRHGLIQ